LKPPQFFSDVYRDLRDRHLLLPAIGLLVALVAVPVVLKSNEEPAPVPPAASVAEASDSELTAAVLADDSVSVRNYRKRLAALKRKNPFQPQFVPTPNGGGSGATAGGTATASSGSSGSTESGIAGSSSSGGAGPAPVPTLPDGPTGDTTTVDDTTGNGNGNGGNGNGNGNNQPSDQDVEVVNHLVTRRVDLTIGVQGNPKLRENVKPMTILPDSETPVVAYLGTDEEGKRAAFVVAKDATLSGGTAACVPAPENCLYITLQKGETATLDFGPDGQTYDLRLLEIRDVELKAE